MFDRITRRHLLRKAAGASVGLTTMFPDTQSGVAQTTDDEPKVEYRVRILTFLPDVARGGRVSTLSVKDGELREFRIWFEPEADLLFLPTAAPDKPKAAFPQRPSFSLKIDRLSKAQVLLDTKYTARKILRNEPKSHVFEAVTTIVSRVQPVSLGEKVLIPSLDDEGGKAFELVITRPGT